MSDSPNNVVTTEPKTSDNMTITPATNKTSHSDYEKCVTDKENSLINSFSNLITSQQQHNLNDISLLSNTVPAVIKTNGKVDFNPLNNDSLIITNNTISNGNGHHGSDVSLDNKL